jgi:hypothetical protein
MNLAYISALILPILDLFGRAGGGGSSSGGSGGGGGWFVLIGYLPMHFIGSLLRKKLPIKFASIIGWTIAPIYSGILFAVFGAGWGIILLGCVIAGTGAGLYKWFDKVAKLTNIAKKKQVTAAQKDSVWEVSSLNNQVSETFNRYQNDWSNNNIEAMKSYLSPRYYYHNQLMILALKQLGRRNDIKQPTIAELNLLDIQDEEDNLKDSFTMNVVAKSVDDLYDEPTNTLLFEDKSSFSEFWRFIRTPDGWLLDKISQATENKDYFNRTLQAFAESHNYCFSADWGWLLLPCRGQLFKGGKFGKSDINNHVIGIYNNILIQLYNYVPNPNNSDSINPNSYIIAQVALPKTYGNIVVRKKHPLSLGINGLTKITMEWGDFNKNYEVWASDMERVTSFELLNPSFMVKLQEMSFEINIEVVDNIVYLYSKKTVPSSENYEKMLSILQQAFKEMRM